MDKFFYQQDPGTGQDTSGDDGGDDSSEGEGGWEH